MPPFPHEERQQLTTTNLLEAMPQRQTFVSEFLDSARHSLIQSPAEGAAQLCNQIFGTQLKPDFAARPSPAEFGTSTWHAQQLGSVAGTLPWLLAMHKGVKCLTNRLVVTEGATNLTLRGGFNVSRNGLAVLESGTVGFAYGGVLTPVRPDSQDFWADRSKTATASALTFAAMTRATQVAKDKLFRQEQTIQNPTLASRAVDRLKLAGAGAFGGLVAGPVDAGLHSWMHHRRLPEFNEVLQSAYSFTLIGAGFGALDKAPDTRRNPASAESAVTDSAPTRVPPTALSPEAGNILNGARTFATDVTAKFPQVDASGALNYYFGGSLATMLLLEARSFRPLDPKALPQITPGEPIAVTQEAVHHLAQFVRRIGDVDYVSLPHYQSQSGARLRKGGGSILLSELSPEAREVLKAQEGAQSVFTDPVEACLGFGVVEVEAGGKKFYVGSPHMMHAYKLLHLAESLGRATDKTGKFVGDLTALVNGLEAIYPREVIDAMAHRALFEYMPRSVSGLFVPYQVPEFTGQPRLLFERAMRLDPDFKYLDSIGYGREHSVTFLRALHRFSDPSAKQMVVDFIRDNRNLVDRWDVRTTENNNLLLADYLLKNPDQLAKYGSYLGCDNPTRPADLLKGLETHPWILRELSSRLPQQALDMAPARSELLDLLGLIKPEAVGQELPTVRLIVEKGAQMSSLHQLLTEVQDPTVRRELFTNLGRTAQQMDAPRLTSHLRTLVKALETYHLDSVSGRWVTLRPEQANARLMETLKSN